LATIRPAVVRFQAEGNKLTIDFDRAGQKKVLDGFVTPV
jgi:hypothetical protein